ncbi:MAG: DUF6544 family protein [Bacteroidales bacterium]
MKKLIKLKIVALALTLFAVSCQKSEWNEMEYLLNRSAKNSYLIEDSHLASFPPVVQNYLETTGVVGTYYANSVKFTYTGDFKLSEDAPWAPMDAVTYITYGPVSRNWIGEIDSSLGKITGLDYYYNGKGKLDIRLFPSIPFQVADGPELDIGELLTILAEIVFNPSACLNTYIEWEQLTDYSAKATIHDAGISTSGIFYFDENHLVTHFETDERYLVSGDRVENHVWTVYVADYKEFDGILIPSEFSLMWHLPSTSYEYIRATVDDIEFNPANI